MMRSLLPLPLAAAAALLLHAGAPAVAAQDVAASYEQLIEQKAPSIVNVRLVLKIEMTMRGQSQSREQRQEMQGVLVSADGLVLVDYSPFASSEPGAEFEMKRAPTEIKVIFEGEEKEYDARLVATDKKVNLAFLKVKDLEGRAVAPVSFESDATADIGSEVVMVSRMEKGFDYAPLVRKAVVAGAIKKPRKALILDGSVTSEGLPVFSLDGRVVGVVTTLESGLAADEMRGMRGLFGMSGGRRFILPAKPVARLVEQAARQAEEAADDEDAAPADASSDDGGADEGADEPEDGARN